MITLLKLVNKDKKEFTILFSHHYQYTENNLHKIAINTSINCGFVENYEDVVEVHVVLDRIGSTTALLPEIKIDLFQSLM